MVLVVNIRVRLRIDVPREIVWGIVSDFDNDTFYWRGITSSKVLFKGGLETIREVMLGDNNLCIQALVSWPMEKVQIHWLRGVIRGTREIILSPLGNTTLVEVRMNYEFPGLGRSDSKLLAKLFQNEAELAVDLIKKMSENCESSYTQLETRLWVN